MSVSTAILFLAACACDMQKVSRGMYTSQVYIVSGANLFLFFIGKEWTDMAAPWAAHIGSIKITSVV